MNDKVIWNYLLGKINNPYGVAGLMGNLYAESGLNPRNLQGSYESKLGYSDDSYTEAVDSGRYSAYDFAHDKAGYGLAQWMYWSRKEKLYNFAKDRSSSIGDLSTQLDYLWSELQDYPDVIDALRNAKTVRQASDVVLTRNERPTNQGDAVKQKRAGYG